ncbi:MAG: ATP-binding cassette domain-containing protein [Candidatus Paceibacterota bacterium]|jgi:ATPase subunit of ABC transporter with duplicated ATPase domains|nr:ATP-binding cassette domain-containing protein [bacterium]
MSNEVIIRFDEVSFEYDKKLVLNEASFSIRRNSKITLMGQNGAGKSTIFQLIIGALKPESGKVHLAQNLSVAIARQVIPRNQLTLTVREFFEKCFPSKVYDIDPKIDNVLEIVNLVAPKERTVGSFSGGQQARLLLASALIQDADVLLLDEPTNNLDHDGIVHLTKFIIDFKKTCVVISHDADFLNSFTQAVIYLDIYNRKVEQYVGNYYDVVKEISAQVEKQEMKNAQLAKGIQENRDKANFFANKGGQMRMVAKRMRDKASEMEENKVELKREDKTIKPFKIPIQEGIGGELMYISSLSVIKSHKPTTKKVNISLRKNEHLLLLGPNGIGKTTLLESLALGTAKGAAVASGVEIGYYRQDFSTLNFDDTVFDSLLKVAKNLNEEQMRSIAAGFLISGELMRSKIGSLSEGQKGLVSFARLVMQKPGLLILDEPTNHINFRHLPIIAQALDKYEGAMIIVSHVPDFVKKIRIDEIIDLERI